MTLKILIFEEPALIPAIIHLLRNLNLGEFDLKPVIVTDEQEAMAVLPEADIAIIRAEDEGDKAGIKIACAAINDFDIPTVTLSGRLNDRLIPDVETERLRLVNTGSNQLPGMSQLKLRLSIIEFAKIAAYDKNCESFAA